MASARQPIICLSKDLYLSLHSSALFDNHHEASPFFTALLLGCREDCDGEGTVINIKAYFPLAPITVGEVEQYLNRDGTTIVGWFAVMPYGDAVVDGGRMDRMSQLRTQAAQTYFDALRRIVYRAVYDRWSRTNKRTPQMDALGSNLSKQVAAEAATVLRDMVGIVSVRGSASRTAATVATLSASQLMMYGYQPGNISPELLQNDLEQGIDASSEWAKIERLQAEWAKSPMDDSTLALDDVSVPKPTTQKKRKHLTDNEADHPKRVRTDKDSKRKSDDSVIVLPDENIQVLPGQRSDFFRIVHGVKSLAFTSAFDEQAFSLPTASPMGNPGGAIPKQSMPANLQSKLNAIGTHVDALLQRKMQQYDDVCKDYAQYEAVLRILDSIGQSEVEHAVWVSSGIQKEDPVTSKEAVERILREEMEAQQQVRNQKLAEKMKATGDATSTDGADGRTGGYVMPAPVMDESRPLTFLQRVVQRQPDEVFKTPMPVSIPTDGAPMDVDSIPQAGELSGMDYRNNVDERNEPIEMDEDSPDDINRNLSPVIHDEDQKGDIVARDEQPAILPMEEDPMETDEPSNTEVIPEPLDSSGHDTRVSDFLGTVLPAASASYTPDAPAAPVPLPQQDGETVEFKPMLQAEAPRSPVRPAISPPPPEPATPPVPRRIGLEEYMRRKRESLSPAKGVQPQQPKGSVSEDVKPINLAVQHVLPETDSAQASQSTVNVPKLNRESTPPSTIEATSGLQEEALATVERSSANTNATGPPDVKPADDTHPLPQGRPIVEPEIPQPTPPDLKLANAPQHAPYQVTSNQQLTIVSPIKARHEPFPSPPRPIADAVPQPTQPVVAELDAERRMPRELTADATQQPTQPHVKFENVPQAGLEPVTTDATEAMDVVQPEVPSTTAGASDIPPEPTSTSLGLEDLHHLKGEKETSDGASIDEHYKVTDAQEAVTELETGAGASHPTVVGSVQDDLELTSSNEKTDQPMEMGTHAVESANDRMEANVTEEEQVSPRLSETFSINDTGKTASAMKEHTPLDKPLGLIADLRASPVVDSPSSRGSSPSRRDSRQPSPPASLDSMEEGEVTDTPGTSISSSMSSIGRSGSAGLHTRSPSRYERPRSRRGSPSLLGASRRWSPAPRALSRERERERDRRTSRPSSRERDVYRPMVSSRPDVDQRDRDRERERYRDGERASPSLSHSPAPPYDYLRTGPPRRASPPRPRSPPPPRRSPPPPMRRDSYMPDRERPRSPRPRSPRERAWSPRPRSRDRGPTPGRERTSSWAGDSYKGDSYVPGQRGSGPRDRPRERRRSLERR
ncbi:hypothetical protein BC832DRAFT_591444 [Gaertneriomyces semiglobifer]|nr:hypothetical protein BC832DRAFT_591444 [Gaertneriomyces semiglobifer]